MKRRPFELSDEQIARYISDLIKFDHVAQTMLSSDTADVYKPYWDRVVADNRIRLQSLESYDYLLHLRT